MAKKHSSAQTESPYHVRTWLVLVVCGAVALLIGVKIWSRTHMATYPQPLQQVTDGNVGEYSALSIIAQEEGYFRQHGLVVTMKEYTSGPSAITDMLAGKLDVATAADYVGVVNSFNHPNLRILATQLRADSFFMAARRDHGITKPTDLRGKKIGVTANTAGDFYLGNFLLLNQLEAQDVTVVNGTPDALVGMLRSGQLDAIVSFDPYIYDAQSELGTNVAVWSMQGDQKLSSLLYGSDELVKKRPAVVEAYLQALVDAQNFAGQHNSAAEAVVGKYLGYSDAYTARIWPRLSFDVSLDEYLLINLEEEARWAIANGATSINHMPDYLQVVYFNGLEAVKPDAVTITH